MVHYESGVFTDKDRQAMKIRIPIHLAFFYVAELK